MKYIDVELGDSDIQALNQLSLTENVKHLLCDAVYNNINSSGSFSNVSIKVLQGGLTNILYTITDTDSGVQVVFRLFGYGTVGIIDRELENQVFEYLSSIDIGPTLYGSFKNGRVEGYIDGTSLTDAEMSVPTISQKVASLLYKLHSSSVPNMRAPNTDGDHFQSWLWYKLDDFLEKLAAQPLQIKYEVPSMEHNKISETGEHDILKILSEECKNYKSFIADHYESSKCQGKKTCFEFVLSHNDLLCGNIMKLHDSDSTIKFIDYEYSNYNYRGFDFANHFNGKRYRM